MAQIFQKPDLCLTTKPRRTETQGKELLNGIAFAVYRNRTKDFRRAHRADSCKAWNRLQGASAIAPGQNSSDFRQPLRAVRERRRAGRENDRRAGDARSRNVSADLPEARPVASAAAIGDRGERA